MAGGLAAIGVIAAIVVSVIEHEEDVAEQKTEAADTQQVMSDATMQAMTQAPLALLGALSSAPGGATSALKVACIAGRIGLSRCCSFLVGALFWPTEEAI